MSKTNEAGIQFEAVHQSHKRAARMADVGLLLGVISIALSIAFHFS